MAKKWDPTSQDYPATLGMPPKGQEANIGNQYYGFSDDQISQMKKAGITVGDLHNMGILQSPEMTTPPQGYTGGTVGGQIMSPGGRQQLQSAAMLKASLAASAANQPQQQQQAMPQFQNQLAPAQPTPTVATTPLQAAAQYNPQTQAATQNLQIQQGNAANASPMFQMGGGQNPWMLPQAQGQAGSNPLLGSLPQAPAQPLQVQSPADINTALQRAMGGPALQMPPPPQGLEPPKPIQGFQGGGQVNAWEDPTRQMEQLGAWALDPNAMSALVANPRPSGTPSSKSGVAPVGGADVSYYGATTGGITLPSGQYYPPDVVKNFSSADWAEVQKAGWKPSGGQMPASVAQGPWMNPDIGSVFVKRATPTVNAPTAGWTGNQNMPLTAATPANAAQMPTMQTTQAQAAQARPQTTFAPMNIAPPPAAPGLQVPNVPTQAPTMTAFQEGFQHGLSGAAASGPSQYRKMQTGGYVFPQDQQQGVRRYDDGGYVSEQPRLAPQQQQDDGQQPVQDTRRASLNLFAHHMSQNPSFSNSTQASNMPFQPGMATYDRSGNVTSIGGAPIGSLQSELNYVGAGSGPQGTGGLPPGGVTGNVASGIGGALTQAAGQIASSVKPWQPIQQAFGGNLPKYQTTQFQKPQET